VAEVGAGSRAVTPVIFGRWQTRIVMMAIVGGIISAIFAAALQDSVPFVILAYVVGFGLIWDVVYILLQKFRWERDWPAAFTIGNGIVEGVLIYALIKTSGLPGIDGAISTPVYIADYALIWVIAFIWLEGPMRVAAPWWRFHGGRFT
jgi:hypothetical protein